MPEGVRNVPWKKDATGKVVIGENGFPVREENGQEAEIDDSNLDGLFTALSKANREAAERKRRLRELESKYAVLSDVDDIETWVTEAKQAMETAQGVKGKKVVDPDEEQRRLSRIKEDFDKQLREKEEEVLRLRKQFERSKIAQAFATSRVREEKTILPPDIAEAFFGKYFEVRDDKIIGKIGDDIIHAPGTVEPADFDTALEVILNKYPMKDSIIKGTPAGSGTPPGGGNRPPVGKTIARTAFDAMSHDARKAFIDEGGKVVDEA